MLNQQSAMTLYIHVPEIAGLTRPYQMIQVKSDNVNGVSIHIACISLQPLSLYQYSLHMFQSLYVSA